MVRRVVILLISLLVLLFVILGDPKHAFGLLIVVQCLFIVPFGYDISSYCFMILSIKTFVPYVVARKKLELNNLLNVYLFFFIISSLSLILFRGQYASDLIITIIRIGIIVFLFFHLFKSEKDIQIIPKYLLAALVFVLIHIYTQSLGIHPMVNTIYDGWRLEPHGLTDQYVNPNEFSIIIVWILGLLMIYHFIYKPKVEKTRSKKIFFLLFILSLISMPLLGYLASRSSILVFMIAIISIVFRLNFTKAVVILPFALVLFYSMDHLPKNISIPFIGESANERFNQITDETDTSNKWSRTALAKAGFQVFLKNPLFGTGLGNEKRSIRKLTGESKVSHNTFISLLAEFGIIGLLFIFYLFIVWKPGFNQYTTFNALLLLMLYGLVHNILFMSITWLILAFSYRLMQFQKQLSY